MGDKQLNYQGNSYGTFLGAVYANLFPDRVGALVQIANINAPAWVTADEDKSRPDTFLNTFLRQDSDKGMADTVNAFLTLCGQATTAECAFSAGNPVATQQKWNTLLQNVLAHPITLAGVTWDYDAVVTTVAHAILYVPNWAPTAQTLEQVWEGNGSLGPAPSASDVPSAAPQIATQTYAVVCAESPNPRHSEDYFALADLAYDRSGAVGPFYSWLDEGCAGWPAVAADRYTGPWDKPTAHPLLLVNTTHDPATPISNAVFMANTFANARLLTVDGYGHVLGQRASSCANNYIAAYFIDGTLPPPDTVCQQDQPPFSTGSGS